MSIITVLYEQRRVQDDLSSIRAQLSKLAETRLEVDLTASDEARYDTLCRQELLLLGRS
jgi:hypothetical protein